MTLHLISAGLSAVCGCVNPDLLTENSRVIEAGAKQTEHPEADEVHALSHNIFTVLWLELKLETQPLRYTVHWSHGCLESTAYQLASPLV